MKSNFIQAISTLGLTVGLLFSIPHSRAETTASSAPLPGRSLFQSSTLWDTTDGKTTSLSSLQGTPVVITMLYTSCPAACPMTIADLKKIESGLRTETRAHVRFAVFSFDSEKDTPARLKSFMNKHKLDAAHWAFFHGSADSVQELAALLGIRYRRLETGDFDHSNVITVLDPQGTIVHRQIGLRKDAQETVDVLHRLLEAK